MVLTKLTLKLTKEYIYIYMIKHNNNLNVFMLYVLNQFAYLKFIIAKTKYITTCYYVYQYSSHIIIM